MSNSQVLTFTVGAAAGVCAASVLFALANKREKTGPVATVNGVDKTPPAAAEVTEPKEEKAQEKVQEKTPVQAEDRPADAPESCPGVSSSSDGLSQGGKEQTDVGSFDAMWCIGMQY